MLVKTDNLIIPKRIQIEITYGCNLSCKMCPVHKPQQGRKKGIMPIEMFKKVIDQMVPYREHIKLVDLWGVGEPLLDNGIGEKIKYAKAKGFRNVAIATNVDLLSDKMQNDLLESGIDSIILGIDGVDNKTHESLRVGAKFDNVLKYAHSIISKRDSGKYKTRFVVRFVKQDANMHQWEEYQSYWKSVLSADKGDMIMSYNIRPWHQEVGLERQTESSKNIDELPCHHVFDRLIVLLDGVVPVCCGDFNLAKYKMGNVNDTPLIDIFNSDKYNEMRKIHLAGKKNSILMCRECGLLHSESTQERWNDDNRWDYKDVLTRGAYS